MRLPAILLALLTLLAVVLAFNPVDRADWALENALALGLVLLLWFTRKRFRLSRTSYVLIFLFLVLHEFGAHYTYSKVPYREAWAALTGGEVGDGRNHFDRFVHFSYGLLLAFPMRELFVRVAGSRGFWSYFLPLDMTLATSALYELVEWGAAMFFGGDLGAAYLGTQGDEWDAQKDMALAGLGAVIALLVTAAIHRRSKRDFQNEWAASFRPKPVPASDPAAPSKA